MKVMTVVGTRPELIRLSLVFRRLAEAGIEGVEIEDKVPLTEKDKEQMFVDILPDAPDNDGIAYLNFYLEEDADVDAILPRVQEALEELRQFMDIGEASIAVGTPLHRGANAVTVAEVHVVAHAYLIAVIYDRRTG